MTDNAVDKTVEATQDTAQTTLETAKSAEKGVLDKLDDAQDAIGQVTPVPTEFKSVTPPGDVKKRLDWGEPGLTIIDIRDRDAYNQERIMGAIPMPTDDIANQAKQTLEADRDIYIYGDGDEGAASAADQMREAGFKKVSTIKGGLSAWKAVNGAVEGQGQLSSSYEDKSDSVLNQTATP